nr:VOC family protein [Amylibacter sp.]
MTQRLAHTALVVQDYDAAIAFYVDVLGFELVEDTYQPEQDKRWVVVRPKGEGSASLVLARASGEEQESFIGNQAGGRVFLFLQTDDFWRDYKLYQTRGVEFTRDPLVADYGTVAVFKDLYGTLWDLVEFSTES